MCNFEIRFKGLTLQRPWYAPMIVAALSFMLCATATTKASNQSPAPSPDEQATAMKLVKDIFREDYAKRGAAAQEALAKQLLQRSKAEQPGTAARFVMMRESAALFAGMGKYSAAADSIGQMEKEFLFDGTPLRKKAIADAMPLVKSPVEAAAIADAAIELAEGAISTGDYDAAAGDLSKTAERAAALAKDKDLIAKVHQRVRAFRDTREESRRSAEAMKTLQANPDDPKANLAVGKFLCFQAGRWDDGLRALAKSGDPDLSALAKRDIAGASDSNARLELGDAWRSLGAAQQAARQEGYDRRAVHWYELALTDASGLMRTKVLKKMSGLPGGTSFEMLALALEKVPDRGAEHPADPGVLVGFRYSLGNFENHLIIKRLQPIWLTGRGQVPGGIYGQGDAPGLSVIAKPGYAIGTVIEDRTNRVNGLKVVFMRSRGTILDSGDSYESQWIGDHPSKAPETLGGNGEPIVGLHISSGQDVDRVSIVPLN